MRPSIKTHGTLFAGNDWAVAFLSAKNVDKTRIVGFVTKFYWAIMAIEVHTQSFGSS